MIIGREVRDGVRIQILLKRTDRIPNDGLSLLPDEGLDLREIIGFIRYQIGE